MARRIWIGAAAGVALVGGAAVASAQQPEQQPGKGQEPAAREKGPDSKAFRAPSGARPGGTERPGATDQPGIGQPKGAMRPDRDGPTDGPKSTERPDKERPKGAERPDRDRPVTTERPDRDKPKAAERPDTDRRKGAERPDKDSPKSTQRPDKDRPVTTERPDKDRPKAAERPGKGAPGRVQLSEKQRADIGAKLRQTRVEKTRVRVDVNVGSRVPSTVRLRPLPSTLVAIAPAYRGHSYFVREDDTIVIVDARTHLVVDVIPATTRTAGLSLSRDQMHFIYTRVPRDRTTDVRVRLALGAEVPPAEQLPFPEEIVARIPEMERYRFVVADDDVAVVDPADNAVVLVISE